MILGYIFIGVLAGSIAAIAAMTLGATAFKIILAYWLFGFIAMALAALRQVRGRGTVSSETADTVHSDISHPSREGRVPSEARHNFPLRLLTADDDPFILQ